MTFLKILTTFFIAYVILYQSLARVIKLKWLRNLNIFYAGPYSEYMGFFCKSAIMFDDLLIKGLTNTVARCAALQELL